jgi:APA family basic amino acid/polyamine antiporter
MFNLSVGAQLLSLSWLAIGIVIYFIYSRQHSKLHNITDILPSGPDFESKDFE